MNGMKKLVESAILEMIQEIERKDMPQIKNKNVDDILELFNKHDIGYKKGLVKCGKLKHIQTDYKPEKVKSMVDSMKRGEWKASPVFISNDGTILDGNHRVIAYKEAYDDEYKIPVISVDLPHEKALKVFAIGADKVSEDVHAFQPFVNSLGFEIVDDTHVRQQDITEISGNKIIVVFPGRFAPFHQNHYDVYLSLVKKFGKNNVYISTSNKVEPGKSPFNFNEKKIIITKMFGIPSNKIIQVSNPYNNMSYKDIADINKDVLIVAVGEKDSGRLVTGKYYEKYTSGKKKPFGEHGYTYIVPLKTMKIGGKLVTGTLVRDIFKTTSDKAKKQLFKKLYGKFDQKIYDLIVGKLNESVILSTEVIEEFLVNNDLKHILEVTNAGNAQVDDGPATFYKTPAAYKQGSLNIKQKSMEELIKELGWQVIDWLAGDKDEYVGYEYRTNLVGDVSFGDVGVRDSDYSDPVGQYQKYMVNTAELVGYSVVNWLLSDTKKDNMIDDLKKDMALHEPLVQDTSNASEPLKEEVFSKDWWIKSFLLESPDRVVVGKNSLGYGHHEAHAFAYSHNKLEISEPGRTHGTLDRYAKLKYEGRIWKEHKIISFWKYPPVSKFKKIIADLEKATKLSIWNDPKWRLEVIELKSGKYGKNQKANGEEILIPLKQYIGSKDVEKIQHNISPVLKKKGKVPKGDGSRKIPKDIKPGETIAQYNARQRTSESLDESLLLEGGAAGHLSHPFDDWNLTFGDLRQLIELGLEGKLEMVQEKSDGQNLMVTWKNGRLRAARNKSHLKNYGANSLTKEQVSDMFAGRGEIQEAFVFAMEDLENAVKKLSDKDKENIFGEGKKFMNLEMLYPATENTVPYGATMLLFHGTKEYDESGTSIGEYKADAKKLSDMIKKINQNIQKHFKISDTPIISLPKAKDFSINQKKFISKLNKLRSEFKLKDTDEVVDYHKKWWEKFILDNASKMKYGIPNDILVKLVNRWGALDKRGFTIPQMKKLIDNEKFRDWAIKYDKEDHSKQLDKNIRPFEILFFELGAEIMKNVSELLSVNPDKSIQKMKDAVLKTEKELKAAKDPIKLQKFKDQMEKLQAIGGLDVIAPSEGIVFNWKGKIWKLTGTFTTIHKMVSLLKF